MNSAGVVACGHLFAAAGGSCLALDYFRNFTGRFMDHSCKLQFRLSIIIISIERWSLLRRCCNGLAFYPSLGKIGSHKYNSIEDYFRHLAAHAVAICALNSGDYVCVADSWGEVYVISTNSNTVVDTIMVADWCYASIAVDENDNYMYVSCTTRSIAVINISDFIVETMISLDATPEGLCILPNSDLLYVSLPLEDRVVVVDVTTQQIVDSIAVGDKPTGICAHPSAEYVYVTNNMSNNISVIRTSDNTVVAVKDVGSYPTAVCCTPDGIYAYISSTSVTEGITVLKTSNNEIVSTITTSWSGSSGIASLLPKSEYVYYTNGSDNSISIISVADQEIIMTVGVGSSPRTLCSVPTRMYIANEFSGDITVLGL